jgi:hypothetical protein
MGKWRSLVMDGSGPPFHGTPNRMKWSMAPSNPDRAGTTTRAKPALEEFVKHRSGSLMVILPTQLDLSPQK